MILLIYGNPQHGKTTIAAALAKETKVPVIHLDNFFLDWCKQYKLPHNLKSAMITWMNHNAKVKETFKEYLFDELEKYKDKSLILEGWLLDTDNILVTLFEKYPCIVMKMWMKKAYHKGEVVGDKDNLAKIIELCKFKE